MLSSVRWRTGLSNRREAEEGEAGILGLAVKNPAVEASEVVEVALGEEPACPQRAAQNCSVRYRDRGNARRVVQGKETEAGAGSGRDPKSDEAGAGSETGRRTGIRRRTETAAAAATAAEARSDPEAARATATKRRTAERTVTGRKIETRIATKTVLEAAPTTVMRISGRRAMTRDETRTKKKTEIEIGRRKGETRRKRETRAKTGTEVGMNALAKILGKHSELGVLARKFLSEVLKLPLQGLRRQKRLSRSKQQ